MLKKLAITAALTVGAVVSPVGAAPLSDTDWAADNGVFQGYADGSYGWDEPVTHSQMATVLRRVLPEGTTRAEFASFVRHGLDTAEAPTVVVQQPQEPVWVCEPHGGFEACWWEDNPTPEQAAAESSAVMSWGTQPGQPTDHRPECRPDDDPRYVECRPPGPVPTAPPAPPTTAAEVDCTEHDEAARTRPNDMGAAFRWECLNR